MSTEMRMHDADIEHHPYVTELQRSTKKAVEDSWAEANKLYEKNISLQEKIERLEKGLAEKDGLDGVTSSTEKDSKSPPESPRMGSLNSLLSSVPFRRKGDDKTETTAIEQQLINQMTEMQRLQDMQVRELREKVEQREASIQSLEMALVMQKGTIEKLRDSIELQGSMARRGSNQSLPKVPDMSSHGIKRQHDSNCSFTSLTSMAGQEKSRQSVSSALRDELRRELLKGAPVNGLRRQSSIANLKAKRLCQHESPDEGVGQLITKLSSSNLLKTSPSGRLLGASSGMRMTGGGNTTFNFRG